MAHRLDWLFGFCIALSDSRFLEAEAMNENEFTKFQTAIEEKKPHWPFWAKAALVMCGSFSRSYSRTSGDN